MTRTPAAAAPRDPFVAAWIATAVDIPLYSVIATVLAYAGAQVWEAGAGGAAGLPRAIDDIEAAVLVAHMLIIAAGIGLVAHTIGRWVHVRTRELSRRRAVASFATMGGLLGLVPAGAVLVATGEPDAALFVAIAIVAPCALVAGLTRLVLPRVAASEKAVTGFAIVAVILVLAAFTVLAVLMVTMPGGGALD
ncbi:hypothetical protein [Demequina mangrovi]|uniref:Uncharacterized protein n=1 Tax=Demequina mangrovi TaxID=1043493 RepID=A0A1H6USC0_9MICO|nr:hypothetical protein [Demequina mangrovi]SEI94606.1 hypothetical protein SAMN05421637_0497 [Demequina mangrovi]